MINESCLIPVSPALPVAPYFGGKRRLAKRIVQRLDAIDHDLYAEPFIGMGGVFLHRNRRSKIEIVNDLARDVANLFRILQRHSPQFMDVLKWQLATRAKPASFDLSKLTGLLEEVHERLSGVVIECLPYADFTARYDRLGALFYLDPPYYGCKTQYGAGLFARDDFSRMAEILTSLKGRFVLSINDRPEIRAIFNSFQIEPVAVRYSVLSGADARSFPELLISN